MQCLALRPWLLTAEPIVPRIGLITTTAQNYNQSVSQSVGRSVIKKASKQLIHQSLNLSTKEPIDRSIYHSVNNQSSHF